MSFARNSNHAQSKPMENTGKNPAEYGYCKDGKVYLKSYSEYEERQIGVVRNTEEEALQYFVNRFSIAENKVSTLFEQVEEAQNKGSYLTKLLQLRKSLTEFDGLGNFIPLLQRLDGLELELRELILNNQIKNLEIKKALIEEMTEAAKNEDWAVATEEIMEIKSKWLKTGPVDKALQDGVEGDFDGIVDDFFTFPKRKPGDGIIGLALGDFFEGEIKLFAADEIEHRGGLERLFGKHRDVRADEADAHVRVLGFQGLRDFHIVIKRGRRGVDDAQFETTSAPQDLVQR